jgi:hypothetical protein
VDLHVDLFGCKDDEDVLLRFGEILQFGGPKRNFSCVASERGGWGVNWDAFNDCWRYIEIGGIWCESEKVVFPLTLHVYNVGAFATASPKGYEIMLDILNGHVGEYAKEGKRFELKIYRHLNSRSARPSLDIA